MKDFKLVLKILVSASIVCVVFGVCLMSVAIAASSHNISSEDREAAMVHAYIALIVGPILIISIWLPWKKILNRM